MNKLYSIGFRTEVLELYRSGIPVEEIVRQRGVSRSRIYAWIHESGVQHHRQPATPNEITPQPSAIHRSKLTLAEKKRILDGFMTCDNKAKFAIEHHIPRSTLYRWSKKDDLIQGQNGKTINLKMYVEAIRSNEKLQKMIEVLQKVNCTVSSPLQEKMDEMDRLAGAYSHRVLCNALCVDRATYYNHLHRNKREAACFNVRRAELRHTIEEIYHENHQIPGIKKMRAILVQKGHQVSLRIVRELMNELGITSIRNHAKQIYLSKSDPCVSEINLRKQCPGDCPDQIWVSDFTFFRIREQTYYVCIIMDYCSRRVLAYKVGHKATTQMLTTCFQYAFALRKPAGKLIFHSGQGCQYTSFAFKSLLKEHGVTQSFSRKGKPTDNAVMESFNRNFKQEELYRHDYLSEKKFKDEIAAYIKYYNEVRPHESLGYATPVVYEQKFLKQDCPDTVCKS